MGITKPALTLCIQERQQTSGKGRLKRGVNINKQEKEKKIYTANVTGQEFWFVV